jgi:uncharacterized protein YndB with AHSA1/START domain
VIPSQIEKEILIEAPIDVVWRAVTEPDQIKQWFSQEAEIDPKEGGEGRLSFPSGQTFYLQIEAFEPPRRFAFRWVHPEGTKAQPDNSMMVEFTLESEAGNTRLRVVESGFDQIDWADEKKAKYFDDHSRGWAFLLGRLRDFAPRAGAARRD